MARLDTDRQKALEPKRMDAATKKIEALGFVVKRVTDTELNFIYKGKPVYFFPYSGWHSGSTIKDGRGLAKLLKQIKS